MEIRICGIAKAYGKKQVLKDVSLDAAGGSCIGILGSNGSGKSTLLSILAGVLTPDTGSFSIDGKDLLVQTKLRSALVGYVPQGTPLIEELTAWDNLLLWYDKEDLQKELSGGVLSLLGIHDFLRVPVKKLSGGMKKRLTIGCAMAHRPPILLLDEPTAALDLACKKEIFSYLQAYRHSGGVVFLTTHDAMELGQCDRLYILKDGCLLPYTYTGDMGDLLENL